MCSIQSCNFPIKLSRTQATATVVSIQSHGIAEPHVTLRPVRIYNRERKKRNPSQGKLDTFSLSRLTESEANRKAQAMLAERWTRKNSSSSKSQSRADHNSQSSRSQRRQPRRLRPNLAVARQVHRVRLHCPECRAPRVARIYERTRMLPDSRPTVKSASSISSTNIRSRMSSSRDARTICCDASRQVIP